jgi:hypothetical protein
MIIKYIHQHPSLQCCVNHVNSYQNSSIGRTNNTYVNISHLAYHTYTPDKKFTGLEKFTFQVNDSNGASSEVATVSIAVSNKMKVDKPSIDLDRLLSFIFKFIKNQIYY